MTRTPLLSRRATFAALSASTLTALIKGAHAATPADIDAFRDVCLLTPQSIEGPYYLDPGLVRAQIAEGRTGVPLRVDLRVIDGATCKPSKRARVDIWHADAQGIYSGYEGQGDKQDLSTVGQNSSAARSSPTARVRSASKRSIRVGIPAAPPIFTSRYLSITATSLPGKCIFPTR